MNYWAHRHFRVFGAVMVAFVLPLMMPTVASSGAMRDVDVAIVFAVDTSFSIDRAEALRQRDGHVQALRSKPVLDAIKGGPHGCIAIAYLEWSGSGVVRHVLPWTLICSRSDAAEAAKVIEADAFSGISRLTNRRTSLSYAIDVSSIVLKAFPAHAERKVIDISSNGINNDGVPVNESRDRAVGRGHVINAIVLPSSEYVINGRLPTYFRSNVIGGPGSFVISPGEPEDYRQALLRKLVREIAAFEGVERLR